MMLLRRVYRRTIPLVIAAFAVGNVLLPIPRASAQDTPSTGYVLGPNEGEHLMQRGGNLFIKIDPTKGSKSLAMGTQQVLAGVGIPPHRHSDMDEFFYVIDGHGAVTLGDERHSIEKGTSIFIPKNTWHGFENTDGELTLLWIVAPAGLENFFREVATRPGVPPVQRTKAQLNEIASKYMMEFR